MHGPVDDEEHRTRDLVLASRNASDEATGELMALVYDELRDLARRVMQRESSDHTLQPTALVHEAYLKLLRGEDLQARDRSHFFAIAARAMRRVLVDHAAAKKSQKRGGGLEKIPIESQIDGKQDSVLDFLALDEAIEGLRAVRDRVATVVELRYFAGMTVEETAQALDMSSRAVADDWVFARAWLARALKND